MNKIIQSKYVKELENRGVNPLSGEGCQLGWRIDTDVSPKAKEHVESFYGGMKLTHYGFNGWAFDGEKYHASRTRAYKDHKLKAGWSTHDGWCFKLHRDHIEKLLVYLVLNQDNPYVVVMVEGGHKDNMRFEPILLVFDKQEEFESFRMGVNAETPPDTDDEALEQGFLVQKRQEWSDFSYSYQFGHQSGENVHGWTGKRIS